VRRAARRLLIVLAALVVLAGGAATWLLGTEAGARFAMDRVVAASPVSIETRGLAGTLAGPLHLEALRVDTPVARVEVDELALDWSPLALLAGHVRIMSLHAGRLLVELRETDPGDGPSELPALGLPLRIDELVIERADASSSGKALLTEAELRLAGGAFGRGLDVERISLSAVEADVDGHARLSADQEDDWSVDLEWRAGADPAQALAGRTRVSGRLDRLEIDQSIEGLVAARVEGLLLDLSRAPSADLQIQLFPLAGTDRPWPEVLDGAGGALHLTGGLEAVTVAGRIAVPSIAEGEVAIDWRGGWRDGTIVAEPLRLGFANGGSASITGRLGPGGGWNLEADLEGEGLGWPLGSPEPMVAVPDVALDVRGNLESYAFRVRGRAGYDFIPVSAVEASGAWEGLLMRFDALSLDAPGEGLALAGRGALDFGAEHFTYRFDVGGGAHFQPLPPLNGSVAGEGDTGGLVLSRAALEVLGGRLDGAGRLRWDDVGPTDLTATATDLDPSTHWPGIEGRVSGQVRLTGGRLDGPDLAVEVSGLTGTLHGRPLSGGGRLERDAGRYRLSATKIGLGSARLAASGHVGETVELTGSLEIDTLGDVVPEAAGRVEARLSAGGPASAPVISAEGEAEGLRVAGLRAESVRLEADLDLGWRRDSVVTISATGLDLPGKAPADVEAKLEGVASRHRLLLEGTREGTGLSAEASGGLAGGEWAGEVTRLDIEDAGGPVLILEQPASLGINEGGADLGAACLSGRIGRACLDGAWRRNAPARGHVLLEALDLEATTRWLGLVYLARGKMSGEASLEATQEAFTGLDGRFDLGEGAVFDPAEPDTPLHTWRAGHLELEGDAAAARAAVVFEFSDTSGADADVRIGWNEPDPPLSGRARTTVDALPVISEILPDVTAITGRASTEVTLSGTLSAPELTGTLVLEDGAAQVPALGLHPKDIQARVEFEGRRIELRVSAESGEGLMELGGGFEFDPDGSVVGRVRLSGNDILFLNMPQAQVFASPDLQFTYRDDEVRIVGEVVIPTARLTGLIESGAFNPSPDEVIIGEVRSAGPAVVSRIRLVVGPDVTLNVRGLSGNIDGELLTIVDPPALPAGRGKLRVRDGEVVAFGQRLTIERGELIYTGGPLEDPAIDISATREVADVRAGIRARGTLQEPNVTLFSDPQMSRAEILSYLTTGKPINELRSGEEDDLSRAATSLALAGGSLVTGEVGARVGIDELGFEGDDETGNASLVIGKYLSPQLFVSYGVGLLEAVNVLRVRYRLSRALHIEVATSEESSADVIYSFDRD
jgi:translocation and assembly module TamB